ncbi:MAG: hypothetical protein CMP51_03300 [Flavobacteriales bacterium]|nr:hypothetical protein [Flavobacteriales bacterium]|tara:strand:- start:497 stop:1465 length:969 start_codon:yes stop_codon:yes gene_type:complete
MKKNLRNVLVLALGLTTTIAFSQMGAVNKTWIDNSNSEDRTGNSRTTVSADWGGIHVSTDWSYALSGDAGVNMSVYEAYASTDVMGFGTLTMGQQDLSYGSGALISSNSFGTQRYTTQGLNFNLALAGLDITAGMMDLNTNVSYVNASGSFAGADVNILMMSDDTDGANAKAHGYDLGYTMGDFAVSASMNSDWDGDEMTMYSGSYSGVSNLVATVSQTEYKGDFGMATSAWNTGYANGNLGGPGGLVAGDKNTSMGITYSLSGISLGYTRHSISNDAAGTERESTSLMLGYSLNDNCDLGMYRWSNDGAEDVTWLTVTITM